MMDPPETQEKPVCTVLLEICAGNIESVIAAAEAGAHRIELCTDLASGGTTPSYGLIATAVQLLKEHISHPELMILIRPRPGSFVYTTSELQIMRADIRACRSLGAAGVVFGCLQVDRNGQRRVDLDATDDLLKVVEEERWEHDKPGRVTFHRAFDDCHDLDQAFEDICSFHGRIDRILTSGGCASAMQGLPKLKELSERAKYLEQPSPRIMPGAGITAENVLDIVRVTGALEVHASAKDDRRNDQSVGDLFRADNLASTSARKVEAILRRLSLSHYLE